MTIDRSHLNALELRASNERLRRDNSKTVEERKMRDVWVRQCEKEIDAEYKFLGLDNPKDCDMTMDEIMKELEI